MRAILVALSLFLGSGCASGADDPSRVDIRDLPERRSQLLGSLITTQGCLADTSHGAYIGECGQTDERAVTEVSDPTNLIPSFFVEQLGHLRGEIEVVVVGALVQDNASRGKQIYLEIRSIAVPAGVSPN